MAAIECMKYQFLMVMVDVYELIKMMAELNLGNQVYSYDYYPYFMTMFKHLTCIPLELHASWQVTK